jgi:hypothetical protein
MILAALADVRALVEKHLPAEYRQKFTWRQFAEPLKRAAEGQRGGGFHRAADGAAA